MLDLKFIRGSKDPDNLIKSVKYDIDFKRKHPEAFPHSGTVIFSGAQGSGKSLSLVHTLQKLVDKYPDVLIISNMALSLENYNHEILPFTGLDQVASAENGLLGIILVLDELPNQFSSLESKEINPEWLKVICMQRKRRLLILGTAQLFSRIAKCWREQFSMVVECRRIFKYIQLNSVVDYESAEEIDGKLQYRTSRPVFWFPSPDLYNRYDTWQRIQKVVDSTQATVTAGRRRRG